MIHEDEEVPKEEREEEHQRIRRKSMTKRDKEKRIMKRFDGRITWGRIKALEEIRRIYSCKLYETRRTWEKYELDGINLRQLGNKYGKIKSIFGRLKLTHASHMD